MANRTQNDFQPGELHELELVSNNRDEILVERGFHLCSQPDQPLFEHNFKIRYKAQDPRLLWNEHLLSFFEDDCQIPHILPEFMAEVSEPLTEEYI